MAPSVAPHSGCHDDVSRGSPAPPLGHPCGPYRSSSRALPAQPPPVRPSSPPKRCRSVRRAGVRGLEIIELPVYQASDSKAIEVQGSRFARTQIWTFAHVEISAVGEGELTPRARRATTRTRPNRQTETTQGTNHAAEQRQGKGGEGQAAGVLSSRPGSSCPNLHRHPCVRSTRVSQPRYVNTFRI